MPAVNQQGIKIMLGQGEPKPEKVQTTKEILASLKTTVAALAGQVVVGNVEVSTNDIRPHVLRLNEQLTALEKSLG